MEKLNPKVTAVSLGITASLISAVCFALIAVLPLQTVITAANTLFHGIDISSVSAKSKSITSLLTGLVLWFVIAALSGFAFALIYNWCLEKVGNERKRKER